MNLTENCTDEVLSSIDGTLKTWTHIIRTAIAFCILSSYQLLTSIIFEVVNNRKKQTKNSPDTYTKRWIDISLSFIIPICHALVVVAFASLLFPLIVNADNLKALNDACVAFIIVETWCQNLGLIFAFLMLWLRIKLFFSNQVLKTMQSRTHHTALNVNAIVMIVACLQVAIVQSISHAKFSCGRCISVLVGNMNIITLTSLILKIVVSSLCMIFLAILLIWPLKSNWRRLSDRTHTHIRQLSKRISFITIICLSAYFAATSVTLVAAIVFDFENNIVHNLIFDLMLFINVLAITVSFSNWRDRLFPFYQQILHFISSFHILCP